MSDQDKAKATSATAKPKSDEKALKLIKESRERFCIARDAERENREAALEDLKFLKGGDEQWDKDILEQRKAYFLPVLTFNRLPTFVAQVVNDLRQNMPSIKVTPKDNGASHEVADIFSGLIRNIEYNSMSDVAYDNAAEAAIASGYYGYFRIITRPSDNDGFEQDILIRPVWNQFSVSMDPFFIEPDQSDCQWAHIVEDVSEEEFEKLYPGVSGEWENDHGEEDFLWRDNETIRVAEYFWREEEEVEIGMLQNGMTFEMERIEKEGLTQFLAVDQATGKPRVRKVKRPRIMWCKMTGGEILEGPQRWPGSYIPIIRVEPKVTYIEGKKYLSGLIRNAKPAQQYYNYDRSRRAELLALAPKAPFVGTAKQFAGFEELWRNSNIEPLAFLPTNHDPDAPGFPQRMSPPALPPDEEGAHAVDDIKATMGIFDASLGNKSNEQSGKAIVSRQRQADKSFFHFQDNLVRAIRCLGLQLLDLIPKIYDTERIVRVMDQDGKARLERVNQQVADLVINDLSLGKYDVVVTSGPSYASQRLEESDALVQLVQAVPNIAPAIMDLVIEGMAFPNSEKIAERIRAGMPAQLVNPGQPQPPAPPDPKVQAQQIQLQGTMAKTQAEIQKAKLDVAGKQLDVMKQRHELGVQAQQAAMEQQQMLDQHALQQAAARGLGSQQSAIQRSALADGGLGALLGQ